MAEGAFNDETDYPESYIEGNFEPVDARGQRFDSLRSALEEIATVLQENYSGELAVERHNPQDIDARCVYSDKLSVRAYTEAMRSRMCYPSLVIYELTKEKRLFGLIKNEKIKILMSFGEVFSGEENGCRELDVMVRDARAELALRAYAPLLVEQHGLTGINIQRMH